MSELTFSRTEFKLMLAWWEKKRLVYNGIMLLSGILLLVIVHSVFPLKGEHGNHSPFGLVFYAAWALFYAFFANVFFTAGYLFEALIIRKMPELLPRVEFLHKLFFRTGLFISIACNVLCALSDAWVRNYYNNSHLPGF